MSIKQRIAASVLGLSAAGLVGTVAHEAYTSRSIVPTKNDRPTIGYGSTYWEDGTPVKLGETITPDRALVVLQAHISKEEAIFQRTLKEVKLYQGEYDVYFDFVYQYGTGAWSSSPMLRELKAGNYREACQSLRSYRFLTSAVKTAGWEPYKWDAQGKAIRWKFDCSTPGNKTCRGVWTRQLERINKCMELQ